MPFGFVKKENYYAHLEKYANYYFCCIVVTVMEKKLLWAFHDYALI
jgi:hypothetical protein